MSIYAAQWRCIRSPSLRSPTHRILFPLLTYSRCSQVRWNSLTTQPPRKQKTPIPKLAEYLKERVKKASNIGLKPKSKAKKPQSHHVPLVLPTKGPWKGELRAQPKREVWRERRGESEWRRSRELQGESDWRRRREFKGESNAELKGEPEFTGGNARFWTEDWGEDKLQPPAQARANHLETHNFHEAEQPHSSNSSLEYTRRIEGLIDDSCSTVLRDLAPPSQQRPIAKLAHGLDRVLFNPGVHWLQDPRSFVYNLPPSLQQIPKVSDFAFERLPGFIKSSRDEDLWTLARQEKRTFAGSTSSLSGMLSHIYFLLSGDKPVDTSTLTGAFKNEPKTFTPGQRMPSSVTLNFNNGVYAIDSDSDQTDKNILTWMGTLLEKFVTTEPDEFMTYMRHSPPANNEVEDNRREAYRYAKSDRIVMRSQLDCQDKRLPGTGVFDIKTRACLPIRLDLLNFKEHAGYLIRSQYGLVESFEREYYDLIRSAFLKYSFQVRIGNMDGVFVAYHNTARMFGFQYVPLEEMDARLFGPEPGVGERVFNKCLSILECVADEVIRCFPEQSLNCTFETLEGTNLMNIWVEPAIWTSSKPRPIKQLAVEVQHRLKKQSVPAHEAIASSRKSPWSVRWSVSWLSKDQAEIRGDFEAAKERQLHAWNFPSGVGPEQMAQFWKNLNFSGKPTSSDLDELIDLDPYNPDKFKPPSRSIERLRFLSRAGRLEIERLQLELAGKPIVVLGESEPPSNEDLQLQAVETSEEQIGIDDVPTDDLPSIASIQFSTAESTLEGVASNPPDTTESDTTSSAKAT